MKLSAKAKYGLGNNELTFGEVEIVLEILEIFWCRFTF